MEHCKIIAVGDNVCDKYLSRGKMYPGGQCVNTCVYVKMNNMESAYLGKCGDDEVAACVQDTLKEIGIDDSQPYIVLLRLCMLHNNPKKADVVILNQDNSFSAFS